MLNTYGRIFDLPQNIGLMQDTLEECKHLIMLSKCVFIVSNISSLTVLSMHCIESTYLIFFLYSSCKPFENRKPAFTVHCYIPQSLAQHLTHNVNPVNIGKEMINSHNAYTKLHIVKF